MTSVSNKQHSAKTGGWIHYLFKQHERWENVEKNVEELKKLLIKIRVHRLIKHCDSGN